MNGHGGPTAPGAGAPRNLDYRVAHVSEHLAAGDLAELGVRIEIRGEAVLLTGTVPSERCRHDVLRAVREELPETAVHCDLVVADTSAPDHAEEVG
ncbi:hypothetical protein [Streptomyces sp. NPDC098781]|uniref:hypothetical protein n=1 Tax=Streptomyces sp. NPDC098781 TaxID=3366097 RepID=UPI00381C5910